MRLSLLARLGVVAGFALPTIACAQAATPAAATPAAVTPAPAAPPPAPPRLVVFITVDQLIPAYFDRWGSQFTGGLARLAHNGAHFTEAYQDHAVTETAPGHASTMSGRHPRSTGIVANDRGVYDEQAPVIGGGGPGASPYRFRGSVLYDWMRAVDPAARALSVSRKDRGAILPLGRAGRDVYWYATTGRMSTSTWYRDTLPSWVQAFNARRIPHRHAGREWTLLLPESAYAEPDSVAEEAAGGGGYMFPHRLTDDTTRIGAAFAGVPAMDEMLLQFALAGLHAMELGATNRTDLLAVSLSTTDAVGHRWGPDSREIHDHVLRLDRALGAFIDSLYRVRDSSSIAFALTSDHGVASYPEIYAQRHGLAVPRVNVRPLLEATAAALEARGVPATALNWDWGMVYPDRAAMRRAGLDPDSVLRSFASELRKVPGIARVDDPRALAQRDTATDTYARRWAHMIPADYDVPIVASLEPGAYWGMGTSATHGTPHDYDAHVPVIFYGPWFRPGRQVERVSVVDMGPTLARIIGVNPTEPLDGRVLERALRAQ
ncbi:MAG: alkaline phosphatase family protein [Gemmatimonadaceae bacterium]|nr:alkaline phosphatase family protein [Gemmatimonadaceae bacterium]